MTEDFDPGQQRHDTQGCVAGVEPSVAPSQHVLATHHLHAGRNGASPDRGHQGSATQAARAPVGGNRPLLLNCRDPNPLPLPEERFVMFEEDAQ